jgi:hypothetical protein
LRWVDRAMLKGRLHMAHLYMIEGCHAEAEPLLTRVLADDEISFGPNHAIPLGSSGFHYSRPNRPELDPGGRSVGTRLTRRNSAFEPIQQLRREIVAYETGDLVKGRTPTSQTRRWIGTDAPLTTAQQCTLVPIIVRCRLTTFTLPSPNL